MVSPWVINMHSEREKEREGAAGSSPGLLLKLKSLEEQDVHTSFTHKQMT